MNVYQGKTNLPNLRSRITTKGVIHEKLIVKKLIKHSEKIQSLMEARLTISTAMVVK